MDNLKDKRCRPCEDKNFPPLTLEQAQDFMEHIPGWTLSEDAKSISRDYTFKDFKEALDFTNKVGYLAEEEGHHPEIILHWGRVGIILTTYSIGGLSENDIILAAKINSF